MRLLPFVPNLGTMSPRTKNRLNIREALLSGEFPITGRFLVIEIGLPSERGIDLMLKRLNSDCDITPDGWSAYKLTSSHGAVHYHIFSFINGKSLWSKRIDIQNDIQELNNFFIWKNESVVASKLEKLKEGNIKELQESDLGRTLEKMQEQWSKVEQVRLKDELDALA